MRQWSIPQRPSGLGGSLTGAISSLGEPAFGAALLESVNRVLGVASCAMYRTGILCSPQFYLSASQGIPDRTLDCWRAYLSGPYLGDRTLDLESPVRGEAQRALQSICHITAAEVPDEHRAKVYEPYGMVERLSVVEAQAEGTCFALNFYRHRHQRPLRDTQIAEFEQMAPALLALAHKHLAMVGQPRSGARREGVAPTVRAGARQAMAVDDSTGSLHARLESLCPELTPREREICVWLLQGLTFDSIADRTGLALPTVKTYRNRAFARLGIHFRNELFAKVLQASH